MKCLYLRCTTFAARARHIFRWPTSTTFRRMLVHEASCGWRQDMTWNEVVFEPQIEGCKKRQIYTGCRYAHKIHQYTILQPWSWYSILLVHHFSPFLNNKCPWRVPVHDPHMFSPSICLEHGPETWCHGFMALLSGVSALGNKMCMHHMEVCMAMGVPQNWWFTREYPT